MFLKSGIGRRLLSIFFVVAVATILSFFILHMSPVDPVSLQLQRWACRPILNWWRNSAKNSDWMNRYLFNI